MGLRESMGVRVTELFSFHLMRQEINLPLIIQQLETLIQSHTNFKGFPKAFRKKVVDAYESGKGFKKIYEFI